MKKKFWLHCFLFAALGATAACAPHTYAVRSGPPPPRAGFVGRAPGPGYVWCDGYWDWRGGRWFWMNGFWERPPRVHAVWAPAYWELHGRGYRFHRGKWRY